MDLDFLKTILEKRLITLNSMRGLHLQNGDLENYQAADTDYRQTQVTLSQILLLATVEMGAQAANSSPAEIVASGLEVVLDTTPRPAPATTMLGYDISLYATDPLHQQKIDTILSKMPVFVSSKDITDYIIAAAPASPITGEMVWFSAHQYSVDMRLVTAIIQLDSFFGTLGIGATTNNPGNVGNTGSSTHTYASWEEGVAAVAQWLNKHRTATALPTVVPTSTVAIVPLTIDIPNAPILTSTASSTIATTSPFFAPISEVPTPSTSTPNPPLPVEFPTSTEPVVPPTETASTAPIELPAVEAPVVAPAELPIIEPVTAPPQDASPAPTESVAVSEPNDTIPTE
jgi:hypothetical protein